MAESLVIDLRSDTVTKPTPAMLNAMFAARVGDDVYGEDPTINRLEAQVAAYFGKEAALFVPTGTMANQIAVRVHCRPGDELIAEETSHVVLWEQAGPAALSGVTVRTLPGRFGLLKPGQFEGCIRPDDMHSPRTRLIWLENTHNRGGGTIMPLTDIQAVGDWALQHELARHLDGARIWNSIAETGVAAQQWAAPFDTLSVCFSKGLGAPVGSALVGTEKLIREARKVRKLFGGAMRQAGYLAAACIYAMENHVERLREDHTHARLIAEAVNSVPGLMLTPPDVQTNVVWFQVERARGTAQDLCRHLKEQGVLLAPLGEQVVRVCTHLDVTRAECERAAECIRDLAKR